MKILVVGSKGMLGTDVLRCFDAHDEVRGVDIDELDIRDPEAVRDELLGFGPTVVINAAAYTDVDGSEDDPETAYKVNAEGVAHLADACNETEARLVHLSTDYVFDGRTETPYTEEDPPCPLGVYGRSKWEGEILALTRNARTCIVRTAWLYGRAGKNFVKAILRHAETGGELKVVNDQRGSPTYTRDLAAALRVIVEKGLVGTYHVTNSGSCTWYDFAKRILELTGMRGVTLRAITTAELNRKACRPAYSVMSCSKFFRDTGMTLRTWYLALEDYLNAEES